VKRALLIDDRTVELVGVTTVHQRGCHSIRTYATARVGEAGGADVIGAVCGEGSGADVIGAVSGDCSGTDSI
jgi:hypothetical protein